MAKELYVGHLPYEATTEDLRKMFSVAGTVTSVHIITDPETGKSKGCGYVRMADEAQLQEAIECLDGALMENRVITVSIANPQKAHEKPLTRGAGNTQPGSRRARARQKQ
ncbi:MAG: RNA-binding protein [Trichlorobacter sp.]|uniref:RNA recognition motif domain-containing protein n=1 Tax=Trichlorobacter sp. TaxID=2911007 RepID=UPI00256075B0|nr:RNA-binding protein [Trichlorobacter sp.]MDK9716504.1 RNA-binding protein [Trichlorobacter sp.]